MGDGEAFFPGGANATAEQDEAGTGYLMIKYASSPLDNARNAYFQFDLTGLKVNTSTQTVSVVPTSTPAVISGFTLGLELGDRVHHVCVLDAADQITKFVAASLTSGLAQAMASSSFLSITAAGLYPCLAAAAKQDCASAWRSSTW